MNTFSGCSMETPFTCFTWVWPKSLDYASLTQIVQPLLSLTTTADSCKRHGDLWLFMLFSLVASVSFHRYFMSHWRRDDIRTLTPHSVLTAQLKPRPVSRSLRLIMYKSRLTLLVINPNLLSSLVKLRMWWKLNVMSSTNFRRRYVTCSLRPSSCSFLC